MMVLIITFVILFALALLLFIYVKFKKRNFMEDKYNKKEDILLDCLTSFTMKQIPLHYGELKEKPMKLRAEYTRLIFEPGSTVIANMPINKKRNRYVDILPCNIIIFAKHLNIIIKLHVSDDDTRVTLKVNDNGNDYVNASYIKVGLLIIILYNCGLFTRFLFTGIFFARGIYRFARSFSTHHFRFLEFNNTRKRYTHSNVNAIR